MANIRKRGARWQVQIRRLGRSPLSKSFLAKDDAIRWSREQERLADLGLASVAIVPRSPVILSALMDRYQREITPSKRSSSDIFALRQIRRHIGELSVEALTPSVVGRYRDDRLRTVSGSTVRKELTLLSHVLKVARNEWGTPNVDPVASVRKPASARGRTRRPSLDELASLDQALQQCRNALVRDVFMFALATGMRRGEVLSLQWADVDLSSKTALLQMTKNGEARTVPLSPKAMLLLEGPHQARQRPSQGLGEASCNLVFPISANAFRLAWVRVRKRAGVVDLRFHDMRHEAISRFFEMGLSVPEVALISGHKDARMLFRYTHLRAVDVARKLGNSKEG